MTATDSHDAGALKAALAASEARASAAEAQIAALTLMIEKLRRALYGRRSERRERLLDQLELALDELTASASEEFFVRLRNWLVSGGMITRMAWGITTNFSVWLFFSPSAREASV